MGVAQIVKPALVAEPSLDQAMTSPSTIVTPLGPLLPQYTLLPIVMRS